MRGIVTKGVASVFDVETQSGEKVTALARGKLKRGGEIYVGDTVELSKEGSRFVITEVLPRKNCLIRPYVANVDVVFAVIAPVPKPDLTLVDKLIVDAFTAEVEPIIVVNKSDLDDKLTEEIAAEYRNVAKVVAASAKTGEGVDEIVSFAKGKTACFAGQSAVGKSSLLNAVLKSDILKTGGLSKIERGRHTTRVSEIVKVGDARFVDTCGFSMLELPQKFDPVKLQYFYDDFSDHAATCRFRGCSHTTEPDCEVKKAVESGKISKARYDRYVELYNELNEKWRKRYD